MIFRTEELIEKLKIFSSTSDIKYNKFDTNASTLEIKTVGSEVHFIVGNSEYVQKFIIQNVGGVTDFDVSIESTPFFNLLFKTTTETVELTVDGKNLKFEGNGTYTLPVIYIDMDMYHVQEIPIDNVTVDTTISYEVLEGIINYNSKQFDRGMGVDAIQKLFYLDSDGCITFNTGAVVTEFKINAPLKLLLKMVVSDLFKNFRFNKSESIKMKIGHKVSGNITYPVLYLEDNSYSLCMICPQDVLISNYPVDKIRERATKDLGHEAVLDVNGFADALDRFKIFTSGIINLEIDQVGISLISGKNVEKILFDSSINLSEVYKLSVNLEYVYSILKTLPYKFMKLRFGDHQSLTVVTQNIFHVIPECEEV